MIDPFNAWKPPLCLMTQQKARNAPCVGNFVSKPPSSALSCVLMAWESWREQHDEPRTWPVLPTGRACPPVRQVDGAAAGEPAASQLVPLGRPPEESSAGVAGETAVVNPGLRHLNVANSATAHSGIGKCELKRLQKVSSEFFFFNLNYWLWVTKSTFTPTSLYI